MGKKYKLCYIEEISGYDTYYEMWFTESALEDLWGDDWDDAPYEHNAGTPYDYELVTREPIKYVKIIIKIGENLPHHLPKEKYINSPYTLEDITIKKKVPWITVCLDKLYAGASLEEVKEILGKYDNIKIYEEVIK